MLSDSFAQAPRTPTIPPIRKAQSATARVTPAAASIAGPQPLGPTPISSR